MTKKQISAGFPITFFLGLIVGVISFTPLNNSLISSYYINGQFSPTMVNETNISCTELLSSTLDEASIYSNDRNPSAGVSKPNHQDKKSLKVIKDQDKISVDYMGYEYDAKAYNESDKILTFEFTRQYDWATTHFVGTLNKETSFLLLNSASYITAGKGRLSGSQESFVCN